MRAFFIFDVESIGLHGEGFAVAGGIYLENGAIQEEFCFACPQEECEGDSEGRQWVKENVPALDITHRTPRLVRDAFWNEWALAKKKFPDITMAAECAWPVEARFLIACIEDEKQERFWSGPYPLHDVATLLLAAGNDPMANYPREESAKPCHNPLADARHSANLLAIALKVAACFCAFFFCSCNTYHDMYNNRYSSAGGDGDVTFPGGGHITYSQTASLQHVVQGVVALGGSIAGAVAQKSSDALSATKDTNAAGVTKNAADNVTAQDVAKLNAASTDLKTTTHAANAVPLSTVLKKGPPAPK